MSITRENIYINTFICLLVTNKKRGCLTTKKKYACDLYKSLMFILFFFIKAEQFDSSSKYTSNDWDV